MKFIDLFRDNNIENIELVTSDYVLWEFYGHFRDELYVRKLISDYHFGYISANKTCLRGKFEKLNLKEMEAFGKEIRNHQQHFENSPITIERLIGRDYAGFSEMVETLLQQSKFSYKDAIVFVSAVFTGSSLIITHDEAFSCDDHLSELKNALANLKEPLRVDIDFKKSIDFSTIESVKRNYKEWFIARNKNKAIGTVSKIWSDKRVVAIDCENNNSIKIGDYLCLVKFDQGDNCKISIFQVMENNLQDYDNEQKILEGKKVTVYIPQEESITLYQNASVFLYSYEGTL